MVLAGVVTHDPFTVHIEEHDAVAFQVVGTLEPDSARGDYGKRMPGVVQPLLPWTDEAVRTARGAYR